MKQLVHALRHPRDYQWAALRPWRQHSRVLFVAGVTYLTIGLTYILAAPSPDRLTALTIPLNIAPLWVWGCVWACVGMLALISSRWPPASEKWGYSALAGLAAWWSGSYLGGIFLGGQQQALSGAMVWGLVAFLWWGISGLDNPEGGGPRERGEL